MKYECTLKVICDSKEGLALFNPEVANQLGRATIKLGPTNDGIKFKISSQDAVALRASFNSIAKLLSVWEVAQNGTRKENPGKA